MLCCTSYAVLCCAVGLGRLTTNNSELQFCICPFTMSSLIACTLMQQFRKQAAGKCQHRPTLISFSHVHPPSFEHPVALYLNVYGHWSDGHMCHRDDNGLSRPFLHIHITCFECSAHRRCLVLQLPGDKARSRKLENLKNEVASLEAAVQAASQEYGRVKQRNLQVGV